MLVFVYCDLATNSPLGSVMMQIDWGTVALIGVLTMFLGFAVFTVVYVWFDSQDDQPGSGSPKRKE